MYISTELREHQLGSTSTIPMQVISSHESLRGNERNTQIWYLFKHNWRQLTTLIPGELFLFLCFFLKKTKTFFISCLCVKIDDLLNRINVIMCKWKYTFVMDIESINFTHLL